MLITQTHLDFWESKQRQPSWARPLLAKKAVAAVQHQHASLIDQCINSNSGVKPRRSELHTDNLISFVRRYVAAGDSAGLRDMLQRFSTDQQSAYHRRAATARKWLARLEGKRHVPGVLAEGRRAAGGGR